MPSPSSEELARARQTVDDILEAIAAVSSHIEGHTLPTYLAMLVVRDAVERRIEIIGEAVKRLPAECRERHPSIPWADIIAMRNRLAHGYDTIDPTVIWLTATTDLAPLRDAMRTERAYLAAVEIKPSP